MDRLDRIDRIRAHIKAIIELTDGSLPLGRITNPARSEALTMRIVALKESPEGAGLCWREIGPRLGTTADAAAKRYQKFCKAREAEELRREGQEDPGLHQPENTDSSEHIVDRTKLINGNGDHIVEADDMIAVAAQDGKAQEIEQVPEQPQLPEAKPENADTATHRESRMVEETGKVETRGRKNPKIPHTEDEFIGRRRSEGARYSAIEAELNARGIDCNVDDVIARHHSLLKGMERKAVGKKDHNESTPKEAGKATPDAAPETELSTTQNPEPKALSRAELDAKTWEMHKAGKTPEQISDELCSEGYYYGTERVRRMLIQQGAEL